MKLFIRSMIFWFCFLAIAFLNGAFREIVMVNRLNIAALSASQLSCLTGITLWTVFLLLFWKKLHIERLSQVIKVAGGWVFATVVFETFVLDRNLTWAQIAHTYDVAAGEYWLLALTWLGLMPIVFHFLFAVRVRARLPAS